MINLVNGDNLKAKLGSAHATADCPITAHWVDYDATTFAITGIGRTLVKTNGVTAVVVCAGPAASHIRMVKKLTLAVDDTASIALTLYIDDGVNQWNLAAAGTVFSVGDTLQDDGE